MPVIPHPEKKDFSFTNIFIWLVRYNSNFIISFIKFLNACNFLNIPSAAFEFDTNGKH